MNRISQILAAHPEFGEVRSQISTGLSDSVIYIVEGKITSVIKIQDETSELDFYTRIAPKYLPDVRWLARLYNFGSFNSSDSTSANRDSWNWIRLEWIDNPWPREMWDIDARALEVLSELHSLRIDDTSYNWGICDWLQEDIDRYCAAYLPGESIAILHAVREKYLVVSKRDSVVCCGDPYPLNWRVRSNGEQVLIDWQQLYLENAAFDLAGWISTLSNYDRGTGIAKAYVQIAATYPVSELELGRQIAIYSARRWSNNFKLASQSTKPEHWKNSTEYLQLELPVWLEDIAKIIL